MPKHFAVEGFWVQVCTFCFCIEKGFLWSWLYPFCSSLVEQLPLAFHSYLPLNKAGFIWDVTTKTMQQVHSLLLLRGSAMCALQTESNEHLCPWSQLSSSLVSSMLSRDTECSATERTYFAALGENKPSTLFTSCIHNGEIRICKDKDNSRWFHWPWVMRF